MQLYFILRQYLFRLLSLRNQSFLKLALSTHDLAKCMVFVFAFKKLQFLSFLANLMEQLLAVAWLGGVSCKTSERVNIVKAFFLSCGTMILDQMLLSRKNTSRLHCTTPFWA